MKIFAKQQTNCLGSGSVSLLFVYSSERAGGERDREVNNLLKVGFFKALENTVVSEVEKFSRVVLCLSLSDQAWGIIPT